MSNVQSTQLPELAAAFEVFNKAGSDLLSRWAWAGKEGEVIGDTKVTLLTHEAYNAQRTLLGAMGKIVELVQSPQMRIVEVSEQTFESRALHIAVERRIPDISSGKGGEGVPIDEIAKATGIESRRLERLLQCLVSSGIFKETTPSNFANNRISEVLVQNEAFCSYVDVFNMCQFKVAEALPRALINHGGMNGAKIQKQTAFNLAYGTDKGLFEWMKETVNGSGLPRPELAAFSKGMVGITNVQSTAQLFDYPWADLKQGTMVDVGGGIGGMCLELSKYYPDLRFVVQDRTEVVEQAKAVWQKERPQDYGSGRAQLMVADFFQPQTVKNAEVYFLKHIIHDWPDEECVKILEATRSAMGPESRVLIAEFVISSSLGDAGIASAPWPLPANYGTFTRYCHQRDLVMMSLFDSAERTLPQLRGLIEKAGLVIEKVHECRSSSSLIEARLP